MGLKIAIWSFKGGTGKTSISIMLADAFKRQGVDSIALVDGDDQLTAYNLVKQLKTFNIDCIQYSDFETVKDRQLILIDMPPVLSSKVLDKVLLGSNLVIVPCRPSAPDALSLLSSINKIKEIQKTNKELKAVVLVNCLLKGNQFAGDIKKIIDGYGLPVLKTTIGHRIAFQKALLTGSIYKQKNNTAIDEVEHLMNEVYRILTLNK